LSTLTATLLVADGGGEVLSPTTIDGEGKTVTS